MAIIVGGAGMFYSFLKSFNSGTRFDFTLTVDFVAIVLGVIGACLAANKTIIYKIVSFIMGSLLLLGYSATVRFYNYLSVIIIYIIVFLLTQRQIERL